MSLREVLFEKSMERLVATLMSVSSALGMVLLVIGTGTGLVIPALYFLFGKFLVSKRLRQCKILKLLKVGLYKFVCPPNFSIFDYFKIGVTNETV